MKNSILPAMLVGVLLDTSQISKARSTKPTFIFKFNDGEISVTYLAIQVYLSLNVCKCRAKDFTVTRFVGFIFPMRNFRFI